MCALVLNRQTQINVSFFHCLYVCDDAMSDNVCRQLSSDAFKNSEQFQITRSEGWKLVSISNHLSRNSSIIFTAANSSFFVAARFISRYLFGTTSSLSLK